MQIFQDIIYIIKIIFLINKAVSFENCKVNDELKDNRASKIDYYGKDIETETIDNILIHNNKMTPFIIKIDIEGFEEDLFKENYEWINKLTLFLLKYMIG